MGLADNVEFVKLLLTVYKDHPNFNTLRYAIEQANDTEIRYFIEEALDRFDPLSPFTEEDISLYKLDSIVYSTMMEILEHHLDDKQRT